MIFDRVYGVDLGSGSVRIYSGASGTFYQEKNMIASRGREIIAVGDAAYSMAGRQPASISVRSPMSSGMIAELELQEIVLYTMFERMGQLRRIGSVVYFSAPPDMSSIEKRAYYYVANGHWMRQNRVYIVESPIAEALALEISPENNPGAMIVNIGAESSSFSIIADGRIIICRKLSVGGRQMTDSICQEVRRSHHLQIGPVTGRMLKKELGSLGEEVISTRKVIGIDSVSGLPREESVSADTVRKGIINSVNVLASEMKTFLERIPPQIAWHINKEGIFLIGGSARLTDLHRYLANETGYSFNLSDMYENAAIKGLEKIIKEKELKKWASPIIERKL